MSNLRKNVASQHIGFCLNNLTTGAPVTAGGAGNVVIDGGAQAACAGTFTHKGTGQWDYAPTQAETNGTSIAFAFTGTNAIQVGMQFYTIGYDPTVANLPANMTQVNAHSVTDTASGVLDVNAKNLGGTAQTGRDLGASVLLSPGTGTGQISLTSGAVTVGTNSDKTGYALTAGERTSVADALLDRDMSVGTDSGSPSVRTVRQALRFLRNKWSISGTTLTVTKEDDSTSSWTSALTTTPGANPVTTSDPA